MYVTWTQFLHYPCLLCQYYTFLTLVLSGPLYTFSTYGILKISDPQSKLHYSCRYRNKKVLNWLGNTMWRFMNVPAYRSNWLNTEWKTYDPKRKQTASKILVHCTWPCWWYNCTLGVRTVHVLAPYINNILSLYTPIYVIWVKIKA